MDDKEYYSLMNRSSSWVVRQSLKKKNAVKVSGTDTQKKEPFAGEKTYTRLELRQGKADAEMLIEKQD